jgi:predicted GIY-YIG superfamily endonuclease
MYLHHIIYMKTYYVYELYNSMGTVEYVGQTENAKNRLRQHTKVKPVRCSGNGKFYGRQDISMNIVAEFQNRKEARNLEGELKIQYGLDWTERTVGYARRNLTFDVAEEIRSRYVTEKITQRKLGIEYGVAHMTISYIINNKTYTER